ncbi:HNH endonuclease domain-containing protein [Shewanella sp.]|uniref:HNH endonuclease domain-containing protein n=1 Tax=Shewanella sp. TaxID=50422 RepID=UPI0040477BE0
MLPNDPTLDIAAFSRIFSITTNSYKLLLFKSLLTIISSNSHVNGVIDSKQLSSLILAHAWVPSVYYKLNLGSQDQIYKHLSVLSSLDIDFASSSKNYFEFITDTINLNNNDVITRKILKYAPYRLLQPFFSNELQKADDAIKNRLTTKLSCLHFDDRYPIYKIEHCKIDKLVKLTIHAQWLKYIKQNFAIISGWVELNWVQYLQAKNPNSPAVTNKTSLDFERISLAKQRKFWDEYLEDYQLECIFTGEILTKSNYALDHFVPWTYVAHNQYWNLIPIISSCNSAKSNKLPNKTFIHNFTSIHFKLIGFALKNKSKYRVLIEEYLCSLHCTMADLQNETTFTTKLADLITSLIDSAATHGFEQNWTWKHDDSVLQQEFE